MIKAIIVDDEASARNVLEQLLKMNHPEVQVLDKCNDLLSAVASIKKHQPDVVFMDVEMPRYAGFEIVNHLDKIDFEIIFITAYDKYAINAFDISALDYILKPIEEERLERAIKRLKDKVDFGDINQRLALMSQTLQEEKISKISVYHQGHRHVLPLNKIIAIEAEQAYCHIYVSCEEQKFLLSKNLKQVEELLGDHPNFFRAHRSWIVNMQFMKSYSKSKGIIVMTSDLQAKLSKYKKEAFEKALGELL